MKQEEQNAEIGPYNQNCIVKAFAQMIQPRCFRLPNTKFKCTHATKQLVKCHVLIPTICQVPTVSEDTVPVVVVVITLITYSNYGHSPLRSAPNTKYSPSYLGTMFLVHTKEELSLRVTNQAKDYYRLNRYIYSFCSTLLLYHLRYAPRQKRQTLEARGQQVCSPSRDALSLNYIINPPCWTD